MRPMTKRSRSHSKRTNLIADSLLLDALDPCRRVTECLSGMTAEAARSASG